ncbi:piggyBac transposable element-derived protein 4-like [Pecten maximus]|uniref:piggyBac transposable element-derived protein 4-like n=1 Tax=Pecten maximus TaxID=6579 RepID=UPI001457F5B4|nr:piggyBac transposable element-derived protein 4-like [Pecten maximus]
MDSSDESGSEFDGFTAHDLELAQDRLDSLLENASDIDLSDFEDDVDDSDDDIPLAALFRIRQNNADNGGADEAEGPGEIMWIDQLTAKHVDDFVGNPGPVTILDKNKNEMDFFHLIFDETLYQKFADETNKYARAVQEKNGHDKKWYDTNSAEMRSYIAFHIIMGIVVAPNQDMYFTKDNLYRPTGINERITRDRMDKLHQYFHVCDSSQNPPKGQPGHDKLARVRPILESVREKLKSQYRPHKETSIDEAMIAYTGRLGFKQYIPMKPTKRGIKVWMRADPNNGFVNDFQVYTGRENNVAEKGLGERVVKDLTRDIWGQNHHVYCDNYFTTVPLFEELLQNKTYACGTVRANRKGLPPAVVKAKLRKQGDMIQRQKGNLVATAWHDKRTVLLLTTNVDPTERTTVQRKQKDGTIVEVPCPNAIRTYTQNMNGVDRADQPRSTYCINRKCTKWWKYLLWFIVDIAICSSFILMKESPNHHLRTRTGRQKSRSQLEFRQKLSHQLLGTYQGKRKREVVPERQNLGVLHWPADLGKKRTCKQCSKNGLRKEPKTGCEQCGVNLCVPCFKPYHKDSFPELF